ncbi:teichoic acid D-Ala incorporation-associated protein DltX [Bacillus sp. S/N-304-OC-R1]|nr:teichoic acid D-Ala incorporation-associated protein DltX [Bacillus sp. S/N-304-OC-R1]MBY0122809.1 teichoic acid D-Ala incorporation-associated protein DltX [Bacillus sp. S/N-304-OC-R1]
MSNNNKKTNGFVLYLYYLFILLLLFFMYGFSDANAGAYIYTEF